MLILSVACLSIRAASECQEPNEQRLMELLHENTTEVDLFPNFLHPLIARRLDKFNKNFDMTTDVSRAHWDGRRGCPPNMRWHGDRQVHDMDRSTCPWRLIITYDPNRFPRILGQAQCRCRRCYDVEGHRPPDDVLARTACRPIYMWQTVLRKTRAQSTNECTYRKYQEKIAIGCTCTLLHIDKSEVISHKPPE